MAPIGINEIAIGGAPGAPSDPDIPGVMEGGVQVGGGVEEAVGRVMIGLVEEGAEVGGGSGGGVTSISTTIVVVEEGAWGEGTWGGGVPAVIPGRLTPTGR